MRKRQCLNSQLSHIFINFVCKNNKMIRLNLPTFEIKLSGTKEHPRIYDILRRRYIALTPEEWVRQHFVHFLTGHKGYPTALMANEISLSIGNKKLRADSVLYDRIQGPAYRDNAEGVRPDSCLQPPAARRLSCGEQRTAALLLPHGL